MTLQSQKGYVTVIHRSPSQSTVELPNSLSRIDLIFSDQPNLAVDCGVHPSLHPNCHHEIIYCKFIL